MKRIAVIGGGIAGLSAAYALEKQRRGGAELEYVLFEREPRLGGVLVTDRVDDCLVEAGPDSFITEKPWATALARELGLGTEIIGSNDADRKTYIVVRNRLVELPDGLMFMVPTKIVPTLMSPLFSVGTKLRMALELIHAPHKIDGDESVAAMVERHFGHEMVDRLADPLLSGIYGGQCNDLSVRAVLPRFVEMEQKHGSLTRAMLAAHKRMAAMVKGKPKPPLFSSMKNGMQQLVDAVVAQLDPASIRTGFEVESVQCCHLTDTTHNPHLSGYNPHLAKPGGCGAPSAEGEGRGTQSGDNAQFGDKLKHCHPEERSGEGPALWRVAGCDGSVQEFDAVILAAPAHVMGKLLNGSHAELAAELGAINYSSSVTCTLIYDKRDLGGRDRGFGFLVPRSEGRRMLACTFVHNKFPHRAPADKAIVRAFLGGAGDEEVLSWSDEQIVSTIRRELGEIIGVSAEPRSVHLYRWRRCMAQPSPGHLERIARIEHLRKQLPGLALAGNAFHGIGVPDCVRTGMQAAEQVGIAQHAEATLPIR
jgi:oxygen-dependent protoporphyrinogen oxidase